MLARDLAELYGVDVKVLNQIVQGNLERFPGDFMFQLDPEEISGLKFSSATAESALGRDPKNIVYAFTDRGAVMLSSVLSSPEAIRVNLEIMWAFARLREILVEHKSFARKLEELERKETDGQQFQAVLDAIQKLIENPKRPKRWIVFLEEPEMIYRA